MSKLYFRYGAMNSGKTTLLLQVAHNYEERGMKVVILKPKIDTKGNDTIVTRIGLTRKVDHLIEKDENLKKLNWVEILIFSISVSIDSFIIGITYQANTEIISSSLIFMLFSSFLTFVGLEFGKKISSKFGTISKKLGGLLIILIGLYSLIA